MPQCKATIDVGGRAIQCVKQEGHGGKHSADLDTSKASHEGSLQGIILWGYVDRKRND